jgi:hypothetical protein
MNGSSLIRSSMTFFSVCILWLAGESMGLTSGFMRVPRKNGFTSTISST